MTAAAFGPELEHQTRPELVSELVAYLSSEQCALTQQIIEVGAGNYARVFLGRCEEAPLILPGASRRRRLRPTWRNARYV